jgi:hypothetical protein
MRDSDCKTAARSFAVLVSAANTCQMLLNDGAKFENFPNLRPLKRAHRVSPPRPQYDETFNLQTGHGLP